MLKNTLLKAVKAGAAEIQRFFNKDFKIQYKEGIKKSFSFTANGVV